MLTPKFDVFLVAVFFIVGGGGLLTFQTLTGTHLYLKVKQNILECFAKSLKYSDEDPFFYIYTAVSIKERKI